MAKAANKGQTNKKATKTASKSKQSRRIPRPVKVAATPVMGTGRYFAGSWRELREVRWPNRRTTWSLTLAVLLFSAFFTIIVVLLDLLFDFVSKRILL